MPFALNDDVSTTYNRNSNSYKVFYDPGAPPKIGRNTENENSIYKKGFSMVSVWQSHLSPDDGVFWDISPKSIGNIPISLLPKNFTEYDAFYNFQEGGDIGKGYVLNPITKAPYQKQLVPRGDYTRVLAEFWADGPDSETPPGHWFTLLNYVNNHPLLVRKMKGEGEALENLEWDIKSYFILGGAMHDAAIAAWSIKGWYDYIRPISAIRYMTEKGQSTDTTLGNYDEDGIPLLENYIETVEASDLLAGAYGEHVGKIKLYTWKGPSFIDNPKEDIANVGWVLAENWWPYQRPTFVTPPFAGYISGHSTYSRAAAEVLTLLTGSAFFPGGMGEFVAKKNNFLVFEKGPSQDVVLQWATYRDASDQCSLSRIWGGIHPPVDDIPGRIIGEQIGVESFKHAVSYFGETSTVVPISEIIVYPNPVNEFSEIRITNMTEGNVFTLNDLLGKNILINHKFNKGTKTCTVSVESLTPGIYILKINSKSWKIVVK